MIHQRSFRFGRLVHAVVAGVGTLLFYAPAASAALATTTRPNVLFIAVDDMRDWVGYLGGYSGKVHTPNIDRLAAQGVAFTNAHCPSPLCNPSRAAVMTGRMPSQTGIYDNSQWLAPSRPDMPTLPTHFRAHGYTAVGAGKIFHHTAGSNFPVQWDAYHHLYFLESPWFRASKLNYPWSRIEKAPPQFPFSGVAELGGEFDWGSLPIAAEHYDDARTVEYAVDFLGRAQPKPFFLACGIFRPHLPWYAPKRFFDLHPLESIALPPVKQDDLNDVPPIGRKWAGNHGEDGAAIKRADAWKRAVQAYLASISYADEQVGRLLRARLISMPTSSAGAPKPPESSYPPKVRLLPCRCGRRRANVRRCRSRASDRMCVSYCRRTLVTTRSNPSTGRSGAQSDSIPVGPSKMNVDSQNRVAASASEWRLSERNTPLAGARSHQ